MKDCHCYNSEMLLESWNSLQRFQCCSRNYHFSDLDESAVVEDHDPELAYLIHIACESTSCFDLVDEKWE